MKYAHRLRHLLRGGARAAGQLVAWLLFTVLGAISALGRLFRRTPSQRPADVRNILVIRVDLLGDVVMSLPAVEALKRTYANASVTLLTLPSTRDVLAMAPEVDAALSFDVNLVRRPRELLRPANYRALLRLVRELRHQRFDLCLSLQGQFAAVLAWLSGCPRRYGYRGEAYPFLLTRTLPGRRYDVTRHEVQYNLRLAELAGAAVDPAASHAPRLSVPVHEQRQLRHRLAEFEVRSETRLVVLHPGASNGSAKRWLPEYWAAVASYLQHDLGAVIVLTGTAGEADVVREVARGCAVEPVVLAGQTSIPQLGALLKRANLLLSGDTGVAHLAGGLGTPRITLFGPTDPAVYAPLGPNGVILRHQLPCSPCYAARRTAECRFGHVNCMRQLLPEDVIRAAAELLEKHPQQVQP
ncbi:MAG TPA: lipopolysaccharide heptosyltransferase II [Chloroflexota bacterium]|nr:lipopolysaccharide heptosyltransferase II [Chloroflexota bacterium]